MPIRAVYRRVEERGREDLPLLSVYRDHGVVPRDERDDNNNRPSDDLSTYKYVRPGDLVVNKMKTWQGSLAVSSHEGIVSPAYFIGRRIAAVDDRFMHHLLRSLPLIAEYGARSKGIRPAQWDLPWDEFASIKISLPSPGAQRAIADYLDAETARIDALIAKKQRMVELVIQWRRSAIEEALGGGRNAVDYLSGANAGIRNSVPLKRLLVRTIAGGTPDSTDDRLWESDGQGIAWLSIGDMVDCGFTTSTVRSLTPDGLRASRLAIAPPETLLFAMYASLGKITTTQIPAVWNQAILGLVPNPELVDVLFLARWLEVLREHLSFVARSSTQENLNAEQVGELPVPRWSRAEQAVLVVQLESRLEQLSVAKSAILRQIDLLREHRQALITAAVTGEVEIPGVAA